MSEKEEKAEHRYRQPSLVWPVILITAGVLFLLSNAGVLKVDFWNLWRLWPILLILGGLEILLGRRSALGNVIVLILTLAVIGGVVLLLVASPESLGLAREGGASRSNMRIEESLEGVEQADLVIDFAAGELHLQQLTDSRLMVEGDLDLATTREPRWEVDRQNGQATLKLGYGTGPFASWGRGDRWLLRVSPKLALNLDADVGAGDAEFDLTGLNIRDLQVETGAGRSVVILPREGRLTAHITGGVGQLVIEIPGKMAARVQLDRGLSAIEIPERFERLGDDLYQTNDWGQSDNSVDLQIDVGVGLVTIR